METAHLSSFPGGKDIVLFDGKFTSYIFNKKRSCSATIEAFKLDSSFFRSLKCNKEAQYMTGYKKKHLQ
jgi:hypothetical protein